METGTKVLIGVGVGIAVGVGIYLAMKPAADKIAPPGGDGKKPEGGGSPSFEPEKALTKKEKLIAEAKRKWKDAQCNLKTPPPRFTDEDKKAYRDCLHSCDATMHNASGTWNR